MRIFSLLCTTALLTICLFFSVTIQSFADSHGNFSGRGNKEDYARAVEPCNKAVELAKRGDYQGAVKLDNESISIYPYDSLIFHNLGNHLAKLGKLEEARKAQEQAIELEPNFVGAWIAIGLTYEGQRKLLDAERYYRKAVELKPTSYEAVIDLGDVLRQQGHFAEAREWLLRSKSCPDSSKFPGEADKKLGQCDRKETAN